MAPELVTRINEIASSSFELYQNGLGYNNLLFMSTVLGDMAIERGGVYQHLLLIEEPEAHLHPEIQVKLMELFVKLTGKRLKIFITSHSNYMFNKLNNLIIKKDISPEIVKVYHLVSEPKVGSINGKMEVSEDGIND